MLRRRRDTRTRLSQQGRVAVVVRGPARGECTGVPSRHGERYRRYSDEQKQAAVDHYLEYGRRLSRTMRMLGYPKSKELLMAWIDGLAPGQRKLRHGLVPEELKREAVVAFASGRLKSHEADAELGVESSVVRNWKRRMLAGSKETHVTKERRGKDQERKGWRTARGSGRAGGRRRPEGRGRSGGGASVDGEETRGDAGLSGRAGRQYRGPTTDRTRARHPDRDPEGRVGTVGKRAGHRPGKARPAERRRSSSRPLARRWALPPGACCPWSASRAARTITRSTP